MRLSLSSLRKGVPSHLRQQPREVRAVPPTSGMGEEVSNAHALPKEDLEEPPQT